MSTEMIKKFENQRGYYEVNYILRATKVDNRMIGYQLLQIAIMSYLHDPSLSLDDLIEIATDNAPLPFRLENTPADEDERKEMCKKQCFEEMKRALHSVCTSHSEKLEDDNVVFKYIDNVASEIRIRRLIKVHLMKKELEAEEHIIEKIIKICIRKKMKSADSFTAILNHTAGKYGYDEVRDLVNDLYKVVSLDKGKKQREKKAEIKELVNKLLTEKDEVIF